MTKPNYGIDAPGVIRNFLFGSIAAYALVYVLTRLNLPSWIASMFYWCGTVFLFEGMYMIWSSKIGKYHQRERLFDSLSIQGHENILDVGCGKGLLLNGAAKRLTSGKAFGIDLWQAEDLSGNNADATKLNAKLEGVENKIEILTGDMRKMPFESDKFDFIVSSMAIHNIYDPAERRNALKEIVRVLKPGGKLALQDFRNTAEYAQTLKELRVSDARVSPMSFFIFPPAKIVYGTK